ncbi:hypothetical protein BX666DRAFT_1902549 [Dichotomocladium elegans]|nr:hypothetical protein BX666DRAFT_1902549 [Dichotomocladium elegans]
MGISNEVTSRNFSLYGQWLGIASICLLIALGIFGITSHIVFSIVGWLVSCPKKGRKGGKRRNSREAIKAKGVCCRKFEKSCITW